MAGIPQDFIELVRSSTDVVSVVSAYVPLKASGKSFKGLCPFHNEKTPSFHVNPERQIFHCFGCNEGGDAFKFLMLYDKLSFVEAVEQLAGRAGLQVPKTSEKARRENQDRSTLLEIHTEAQKYFQTELRDTRGGAKVMAYLRKRGLLDDIINDYGLGTEA
jgi:DNA primase